MSARWNRLNHWEDSSIKHPQPMFRAEIRMCYPCIPRFSWIFSVFSTRTSCLWCGKLRPTWKPGPEVIKHFSYSLQLSMKFFLLINNKMPAFWYLLAGKISCSALLCRKKSINCWHLIFYKRNKFHSQLSWAWKKFYKLGPWNYY